MLRPPAMQHRIDHRVLRPQLTHAVDKLSTRRARQTNAPQKQPPHSDDGQIMHQTGSLALPDTPKA